MKLIKIIFMLIALAILIDGRLALQHFIEKAQYPAVTKIDNRKYFSVDSYGEINLHDEIEERLAVTKEVAANDIMEDGYDSDS